MKAYNLQILSLGVFLFCISCGPTENIDVKEYWDNGNKAIVETTIGEGYDRVLLKKDFYSRDGFFFKSIDYRAKKTISFLDSTLISSRVPEFVGKWSLYDDDAKNESTGKAEYDIYENGLFIINIYYKDEVAFTYRFILIDDKYGNLLGLNIDQASEREFNRIQEDNLSIDGYFMFKDLLYTNDEPNKSLIFEDSVVLDLLEDKIYMYEMHTLLDDVIYNEFLTFDYSDLRDKVEPTILVRR